MIFPLTNPVIVIPFIPSTFAGAAVGHRQRHPARAGHGQMRGAGALPCHALVGGDFTCHILLHNVNPGIINHGLLTRVVLPK